MAAVNDFCFYRGHDNVGKEDCYFCTHWVTVCLKIIFAVKTERVKSLSVSLRYRVCMAGLFR